MNTLPHPSAHRGENLLLGSQRVSDDQFRLLKINVGNDWQAKVEQLQARCDERRHVPFSVFLLVFTPGM